MINLILAVLAFSLFVYLMLKWGTKNYDVFEKQGIKYTKPYPFIGNSDDMLRGRGMADRVINLYNGYPNEKVVGTFEFGQPIYLLRDPHLIKQTTVKDFAHFPDHNFIINSESDPLFGNVLFAMEGKLWRNMRYTLSPIFTGSKMRMMFELIVKCAKQFTDYIIEHHDKNRAETYDIKDIFSRYTNDAIATCAFGVECNSLKYRNNEIFMIAQGSAQFQRSIFGSTKFLLMSRFPKISKFLGFKIISDGTKKLFKQIIIDTMDVRKKEGIVRPDLLQMLMCLRDGQMKDDEQEEEDDQEIDDSKIEGDIKRNWTEMELIAQCFIFFLAGFDGGSTVLSYIAYELALNPDIQDKLIQCIDETEEQLDGKPLTYDTLQSRKYLEMVIMESLRKWPPALLADRKCVQTYNYEDDDGLKFTIEKGSSIWLPIYGLHMDPKYYPDPEKFDPERFSEESKAHRDPYTFLAFGSGPRNCIGLRFALMQIKVLLYYLFLTCKVSICKETQIPLKFKGSPLGLVPKKPIKLQINLRNNKTL